MFKSKKILKTITAFAVIFALTFLSSCSVYRGTDKINITSSENITGTSDAVRVTEKIAGETVLSSEGAQVYLDKNTGSVSFYDRISGKIWNALPEFDNSFAALFTFTVLDGDKLVKIDSSGAFAGFSYTVSGNSVNAVYELSYNEIHLTFPVTYEINGRYLGVTVDMENTVITDGKRIISVEVLPCLGAVRYDVNSSGFEVLGDYYLVPDGPGAVLRTAVESDVKEITFSVYGKEYYKENVPSSIAAYGIKQGESALSATVVAGDENSLIRVIRSNGDENNVNRIYPEFIITDIGEEDGKTVVSDTSYNGKISVLYEVLSSDSADYMGIAVSVRQALINAGLLQNESVEPSYPLFVSLTGSVDGSSSSAVTSFSQAENILSILKGKGVNEINMILDGFFDGGIGENNANSVKINGTLGGKEEFNELISYASTQQLNVFAGMMLLTKNGGLSTLKNVDGSKREYTVDNVLSPYVGEEEYKREYSSILKMSSLFSSAIELVSDFNCQGIAVLDSEISCNADYSNSDTTFDGYSNALCEKLSALKVKSKVMLDGVGINTVRFADFIRDFSFETVIPESGEYTAVPFLPAVIHSSCIYAGKASNTYAAPTLQLLKCVEYGAVPHYHWVFSSQSDKYYELTLNEAADFYLKAEKDLGELTSKRITDHYEYESGVYCTVYEGGIKVYVNYNNYSVIIGKVSVLPYDYLRIG